MRNRTKVLSFIVLSFVALALWVTYPLTSILPELACHYLVTQLKMNFSFLPSPLIFGLLKMKAIFYKVKSLFYVHINLLTFKLIKFKLYWFAIVGILFYISKSSTSVPNNKYRFIKFFTSPNGELTRLQYCKGLLFAYFIIGFINMIPGYCSLIYLLELCFDCPSLANYIMVPLLTLSTVFLGLLGGLITAYIISVLTLKRIKNAQLPTWLIFLLPLTFLKPLSGFLFIMFHLFLCLIKNNKPEINSPDAQADWAALGVAR